MEYTVQVRETEHEGILSLTIERPIETDGGRDYSEHLTSTKFRYGELGLQQCTQPAITEFGTFEADADLDEAALDISIERDRTTDILTCSVQTDDESPDLLFQTTITCQELGGRPKNSFRQPPENGQSSLSEF